MPVQLNTLVATTANSVGVIADSGDVTVAVHLVAVRCSKIMQGVVLQRKAGRSVEIDALYRSIEMSVIVIKCMKTILKLLRVV